jgi:phosphoribosylanthranilate isomerase
MTDVKTHVKICGLRDPDHLRLAASAGARYAGLVFFPRSPRAVSRDEASSLVRTAPSALQLVGLFVDPDDGLLENIIRHVPLHMIQLHGKETPKRVAEIRTRFGLPVMKAVPVASPEDLAPLPSYEEVADWILFDAKAPQGSDLPGGNGLVFDWQLLKEIKPRKPWMLSGGLTAENVGAALSVLRPTAVDVSSGVEDHPGVKNADKIRAFISAIR